ncbi:MAG: hypothetical protein NPIRA02_20870 [Nitrospirales bacterium]|nr:MAG: hypothetical protein NPIRA02_20870 [Nitrospirales bacterium]
MGEDPERNEGETSRSPFVPIGITVLGILLLPMLIYSNGPEGPIKEGDVVFSTGRHRVNFAKPVDYHVLGYKSFCVIELRDQLLVTQRPADRRDRSLIAHSLGHTKKEFPFCPTKADLILHPHQATLQANTWNRIKDTLARLFSVN